ncbi:MAG: hypothetical protein KIS94_03420 [Chitinophagales bacterium]|nr:hypothetical protein [Chitinophagales bacterium]
MPRFPKPARPLYFSYVFPPWYSVIYTTELADNTTGGTEKSAALFTPPDYHLLLTDTITFQWRNLTYCPKARFILTDTVLYKKGQAVYMNAVIDDSTVLATHYSVNMNQLNLRPNFMYYWCVNYEGGDLCKFHPF